MIQALLETIQLESGIGSPILEDNRPLDYIEWGWIPQIRDFLQHIAGKIIGATKNPPRFRENNMYIMDSPCISTMSYKESMLIHRCRIFLQVEVLSDISDAMGECILDSWRNPTDTKPSFSTKKWPKQSDPGREAWKIWNRFLARAFLTPAGRLHVRLGKWTMKNPHRIHNNYYLEPNNTLYTYSKDSGWEMHKCRHLGRRNIFFRVDFVTTKKLPKDAVPIDIINVTDQNIITSKASQSLIQNDRPLAPSTLNNKLKVQQEGPLLHLVQLLAEEYDIAQIFSEPTRIELASDGGHEPKSGISTYGWVLSLNRTLIAMGRGPAAAHPDLAESFRAEGYGLASVTRFIQILIQHFQINPSDHTWTAYIDNKAMIQ
jgi:hypothetical protein